MGLLHLTMQVWLMIQSQLVHHHQPHGPQVKGSHTHDWLDGAPPHICNVPVKRRAVC